MKYWLDKMAQAGMVAGVGAMLQPWWKLGFRYGFFITAACTLLHIVTSHMKLDEPSTGGR